MERIKRKKQKGGCPVIIPKFRQKKKNLKSYYEQVVKVEDNIPAKEIWDTNVPTKIDWIFHDGSTLS